VEAQTGQIRRDIEQTRRDMSETIEALEEKLRPARLAADATERMKTAAKEKVRDMADTASEAAQEVSKYTRDAADTVTSTLRQNPIPAVLVGIGAAWWLMTQNQGRRTSADTHRWRDGDRRREGQRSRYDISQDNRLRSYGSRAGRGEWNEERGIIDRLVTNPIPTALATAGLTWLVLSSRAEPYQSDALWQTPDRPIDRGPGAAQGERTEQGTLETVMESAEQLTGRTKQYASEVASKAERYADDMTSAVRTIGGQAQNRLQRLMSTNPFLVGVGAMAVGAAIGAMAPETDSENEWMGEARETVLDRAEDMARMAASRVQDAASEMAGEVASRIISGDKS